jgi:CRISPR-associated protein Cas5d
MSEREGRTFRVRARGDIACFTRPEMKVERVSYEVMTPSAARGLLEAVLWKPAIEWRIHAIEVHKEVRWLSFRRNEVNSRASLAKEMIVADEDRAQRNTVALRDVDYVVHASFALTPRAGAGDTVRKFEEMFERRLQKGQHHTAPFFGCREFAAALEPALEALTPIDLGVDRPLGWMFYDFDWSGFGGPSAHTESVPRAPLFFEARLTDGVVHIPSRASVREGANGGKR